MGFASATEYARKKTAYVGLSDAFCGAALLELLVAPSLIPAFASIPPSSEWEIFYRQLRPSIWRGLSWNDVSIAACLIAVGFRLAITPKVHVSGRGLLASAGAVLGMAIILFTVGSIERLPEGVSLLHFQLSGRLQRIAICYVACSLIYFFSPTEVRFAVVLLVLIGYCSILKCINVSGIREDDFKFDNNLAAWIDERFLPGRPFYGKWDPDGLLTTIPAIATCLIGTLLGDFIQSGYSTNKKLLLLFAGGIVSLNLGILAEPQMPIIRSMWTPTYTVASVGLCALLLGIVYFVINVMQKEEWCFPISVLGRSFFLAIVFLQVSPIGTTIGCRSIDWFRLVSIDATPYLQAALEIISNWLVIFWLGRFHNSLTQE